MRFQLNNDNKILMYGSQVLDNAIDKELAYDQIKILDSNFFIYECFLINDKIIIGNPLELSIPEEVQLEEKRGQRKNLLEAFDRWEKAVLRGRAEDSFTIMSWYYSLLNLEDEAFIEVPSEIQYYLK